MDQKYWKLFEKEQYFLTLVKNLALVAFFGIFLAELFGDFVQFWEVRDNALR